MIRIWVTHKDSSDDSKLAALIHTETVDNNVANHARDAAGKSIGPSLVVIRTDEDSITDVWIGGGALK